MIDRTHTGLGCKPITADNTNPPRPSKEAWRRQRLVNRSLDAIVAYAKTDRAILSTGDACPEAYAAFDRASDELRAAATSFRRVAFRTEDVYIGLSAGEVDALIAMLAIARHLGPKREDISRASYAIRARLHKKICVLGLELAGSRPKPFRNYVLTKRNTIATRRLPRRRKT